LKEFSASRRQKKVDMKFSKPVIAIVSTLLLTLGGGTIAHATGRAPAYGVTSNKTTNLALPSENINVTVTGTPSGQGVYIRFCQAPEPLNSRATNCDAAHDVWASADPAMFAYHAAPLSGPLSLSAHSTFSANGASIDCTLVLCGVFVRRDHMGGSTDFALDRFIPVSFGNAATTVSVSAARGTGKITETLANALGRIITVTVGTTTVTKTITRNPQSFVWTATKNRSITVKTVSGSVRLSNQTVIP
jgi:hypothetical protein